MVIFISIDIVFLELYFEVCLCSFGQALEIPQTISMIKMTWIMYKHILLNKIEECFGDTEFLSTAVILKSIKSIQHLKMVVNVVIILTVHQQH